MLIEDVSDDNLDNLKLGKIHFLSSTSVNAAFGKKLVNCLAPCPPINAIKPGTSCGTNQVYCQAVASV